MIRTRFAPSPTGNLHIGGVRTALFSWLYARHSGGMFVLRIEDTDRERSTDAAIQVILDGLSWLGLDADEGPYYQSKRNGLYQQAISQLLDSDQAYYCYCSPEELDEMRRIAMEKGEKPKYDGRCRGRSDPPENFVSRVVRFKSPEEGETVINDIIQGQVRYQNAELDDLIIARSDGTPTYNLTVVVDDAEMKITHVIRGDDHLNNTPRQINIFRALGTSEPEYAHIPLILDEQGKKLSKRHGAASVMHYRENGFLPEALLNYLVRLGWSHGDQEIFSIEEMIDLFELSDVNKSASAINPEKLLWLNQQYLRDYDNAKLVDLLNEQLRQLSINDNNGPDLAKLCQVQKERVNSLVEMAEQSRYFFEDFNEYDQAASKKHLRPVIFDALKQIRIELEGVANWTADAIHESIIKVCEEFDIKLGKVAQPIRVAVTGSSVSPSIDVTLELLGRDRAIKRLDAALEYIEKRSQLDTSEGVT